MSPHRSRLLLCALLLGAPALLRAEPPAPPAKTEQRLTLTAKKFEFTPAVLELTEGTPVVLELRTLDRAHGFSVPELGIEVEIKPGAPTEVRFTPSRSGTFAFHCHLFCGSGHEDMTGELRVRPKR